MELSANKKDLIADLWMKRVCPTTIKKQSPSYLRQPLPPQFYAEDNIFLHIFTHQLGPAPLLMNLESYSFHKIPGLCLDGQGVLHIFPPPQMARLRVSHPVNAWVPRVCALAAYNHPLSYTDTRHS